MLLTVDVPEHQYVDVLTAVRDVLAADPVPSTDAEPRIREAGNDKRPWTGPAAADDAAAVLTTTTDAALALLDVFLDEPGLRLTQAELAARLDLPGGTVSSYRQLLGKQSFRYGERLNPLSADTTVTPTVWYLRPEAGEAFTAARTARAAR